MQYPGLQNVLLFVWFKGANSHGQLGQGTVSEQCATPQPVIQTWTGEVKEISGGGGHSLLINENGWIFACGWNHKRQLGFVDKSIDNNHCHTFTRNWDLSGLTFIKICTGWDSSAAITEKNVLYLWGSNAYGQLGLPREHFPNALKPIQLELKGKTISMGMRHTILVDINGCVWSTGCGKRGQLGLGDSILNSDTFKKIPGIKNIENAVCGQHHTLAWSKVDSIMYAWGDNSHGQLGCNTNVFDQVFFPIKVAILSNCLGDISSIYSGWTHSAVLLNNGNTIYWGRNNYGQLACDHNPEQSHNAPKIKG